MQSEACCTASALQGHTAVIPYLTAYSSRWELTQCRKIDAEWKWSAYSFSGHVQNNMTHTGHDSVECHLPAEGKERVCGSEFPFSIRPLSQCCESLTNSDPLGKVMRNPQLCSLLPSKGKQQPALLTVSLLFPAPAPANVIPSDILKQQLNWSLSFCPFTAHRTQSRGEKLSVKWCSYGFSCSDYTEEEINFPFISVGNEAQEHPVPEFSSSHQIW